jgi:hypothetical protein
VILEMIVTDTEEDQEAEVAVEALAEIGRETGNRMVRTILIIDVGSLELW